MRETYLNKTKVLANMFLYSRQLYRMIPNALLAIRCLREAFISDIVSLRVPTVHTLLGIEQGK